MKIKESYFYSFIFKGVEFIFYTHVFLDSEEEILSWATYYGLIRESDIEKCSNIRIIPKNEIEERNLWFYRSKFCGCICCSNNTFNIIWRY